jgi:hypothetical protein
MRQQTWDDKEKLSKQLEMERANNVVRVCRLIHTRLFGGCDPELDPW